MIIEVNTVKGKHVADVEISESSTLKDFKLQFQKQKRVSIHRQAWKKHVLTNTPNAKPTLENISGDSKTMKSFGLVNGSEIIFKDLGPQIGYRTVFLLEYFGPILFVLLYSLRPEFIYGPSVTSKSFDKTAYLGIVCWTIHFVKREIETVFVHRFSRPTMPLFNLFKNCAYYWSFGAVIGYPLCHPAYKAPTSQLQIQIGLAIFAISELLNFCVHVQLRNMRPKEGSTERPIPSGILFSLVSCPNYLFEILGWVGFSIFTQIFFAYIFTFVGFAQMADWALKKHHNYVKTYGDQYKKLRRKAILPGVL